MLNHLPDIHRVSSPFARTIVRNRTTGEGYGNRRFTGDFVGFGTHPAKNFGAKAVPERGYWRNHSRHARRHRSKCDRPQRCREAGGRPDIGIALQALRAVRGGAADIDHAAMPACSGQKAHGIPYARSNSSAFVSEGKRFPFAKSLA